jgi:hypothetical protein
MNIRDAQVIQRVENPAVGPSAVGQKRTSAEKENHQARDLLRQPRTPTDTEKYLGPELARSLSQAVSEGVNGAIL